MASLARVLAGAVVLAGCLSSCGSTVPLSQRSAATPGPRGAEAPATEAFTGADGSTDPVPGATVTRDLGARAAVTALPSISSPAAERETAAVTPESSTAPLRIGLTYIASSSASAALGVSRDKTFNSRSAAEALIAGINKTTDFRPLRFNAYAFDQSSNNWSSDAQQACTQFTQDQHVNVVVDLAFGVIGGFRSCLQKAGVLVLTPGVEGDARTSERENLHANPFTMTLDRSYLAVLRQLTATHYLTPASRTGVVLEACTDSEGTYARSVQPEFARLGLSTPTVVRIMCTNGFSAAGPDASALANAVLRFKSAGIDRVMIVSDNESPGLLLFGREASAQGYRPGYLLSSLAGAQGRRGDLPNDQWPGLHGVGYNPYNDVDHPTLSSVDRTCLSLVRRGGLVPATYVDTEIVLYECGPLLLLERALALSPRDDHAQQLRARIDSLGETFRAPDVIESGTLFTANVHDGPLLTRVFAYSARCTCLEYEGPSHRA